MTSESSATDWTGRPGTDEATTTDAQERHTGSRPQDPPGELTLDVTFELLMNYRRRVIFRYLADHPSTTLSNLAEHVAAHENEMAVSELRSAEQKRANPEHREEFTPSDEVDGIELYHHHLPKLADVDFIDWDRETDTIRRGSRFDEIAPLISLMTEHQDELPEGWP